MFPNPAITGTAIVKALDTEVATAHHQDADRARAALDEADLHEMEQAAYYSDAGPSEPSTIEPPTIKARRSLLDRLLRR